MTIQNPDDKIISVASNSAEQYSLVKAAMGLESNHKMVYKEAKEFEKK